MKYYSTEKKIKFLLVVVVVFFCNVRPGVVDRKQLMTRVDRPNRRRDRSKDVDTEEGPSTVRGGPGVGNRVGLVLPKFIL